MKVLQVISTHKRVKGRMVGVFPRLQYKAPKPIAKGKKRVEAIVDDGFGPETKHIDIAK